MKGIKPPAHPDRLPLGRAICCAALGLGPGFPSTVANAAVVTEITTLEHPVPATVDTVATITGFRTAEGGFLTGILHPAASNSPHPRYLWGGADPNPNDPAVVATNLDVTTGLVNVGVVDFTFAEGDRHGTAAGNPGVADDFVIFEISTGDAFIAVQALDAAGAPIGNVVEVAQTIIPGWQFAANVLDRAGAPVVLDLHGWAFDAADFGVADASAIAGIRFDGGGTADPVAVAVVGSATGASDPEVNAGTSFNFGLLDAAGLPATGSVIVANAGATQPLTISDVEVTGPAAGLFSAVAPGPIPPGETGQIEVTFDPGGATGRFSATLTVSTNDPDEAELTVALSVWVVSRQVTDLVTSVNDDLEEVLESVTFSGGAPVAATDFTNVTPFSFNNGGGNPSNLIVPGGIPALPDPRHAVMQDLALNSGIINPGAGVALETGTAVGDETVGLGLRFHNPVPNSPGTDALFFELSVGALAAQAPDAVSIALLDGDGAVVGDEVTFGPEAYTMNTDQEDSTVVQVGGATTLEALNTNPTTPGNTVDSHFNLLELDFSDFGLAEGQQASGLFVRGAAVDPVLVLGVPGLSNFFITDIARAGDDTASLTWNASPGRYYNIQRSPTLAPGAWEVVNPEPLLAEGDTATTPVTFDPAAPQAFFRVAQTRRPPLFFDDFESGAPGWVLGRRDGLEAASNTSWELGPPTTGPAAAFSGENVFGTGLDRPYGETLVIFIQTPPVDLTDAAAATLHFYYYVDATFEVEGGRVNIRDETGAGAIEEAIGDEPFFWGQSAPPDWTLAKIPLPANALGRRVVIEFEFLSDAEGPGGAGWYIDDVEVVGR